jgi:hypothetical protein
MAVIAAAAASRAATPTMTAVASRAAGLVTFHTYELRGGEMLLQTPT